MRCSNGFHKTVRSRDVCIKHNIIMNEDAHLISAMNCAGFLRKNDKHCNATMVRALARALGALRFISSRPIQRVAGRHAPFTVRNFSKRGSQNTWLFVSRFLRFISVFCHKRCMNIEDGYMKCVPVQKEIYFNVSKAYNSVSSTRLRFTSTPRYT